jgi:hypothetical protein
LISSGGILPSNAFFDKSSDSKMERFPSSGGICAANLFLETFKLRRPLSNPNCEGILPLSLLFDKSEISKEVEIFVPGP